MSTAKTILATAALVLVLAGCGSSHDSATTQTTAKVSPQQAKVKAEFISRGDAICRHANAILIPLRTKVANSGSVSAAQRAEYLRVSKSANAKLRKLREPRADRSVISKIFAAGYKVQNDSLHALKEVAAFNADGSTAAEHTLDRDGATYKRLARDYGFKRCGATG